MSKTSGFRPVELSEKASACLDAISKAKAAQQRYNRAKKKADEAKQLLEAEFGDAFLGITPDGRLIQRIHREQHYNPLPAKDVTWNEFQELPPWDA